MNRTARQRVLLALLVALPVGACYLVWTQQLAVNLLNRYNFGGYRDCDRHWRNLFYPCSATNTSPGVVAVLRGAVPWLIFTLVVVGLLVLLARWSLRPIGGMAAAVARLGPTNLGERIDQPGGRRDELNRLAVQLNALMDRVAEGYEGQRRFAANASHELRTPLAVQRTLIEVSLQNAPSPEQLDLLTRQLLATNERNEALIEGLLVLSETDRGLISRTPVRIDALALSAVERHRGAAAAAQVQITVDPGPALVHGEDVLLERLLANLVTNAIKYNRPGGSVSVTSGNSPTISVSNTGPVIAPEAVAGLFEPFRRMSGERINHGGGSGLGLTIARSIARAHGGSISAEANLDGGLTVAVELPRSVAPARP